MVNESVLEIRWVYLLLAIRNSTALSAQLWGKIRNQSGMRKGIFKFKKKTLLFTDVSAATFNQLFFRGCRWQHGVRKTVSFCSRCASSVTRVDPYLQILHSSVRSLLLPPFKTFRVCVIANSKPYSSISSNGTVLWWHVWQWFCRAPAWKLLLLLWQGTSTFFS